MRPSLEDMVGQIIVAYVPTFHMSEWQKLKLHGVETAGIWVENQAFTNTLLKSAKVSMSPKTAIFFLPFQSIAYILGSLDVPGVSDEGLR